MQTPIAGKHDDPWLNLWLKALQPRKEYFTHESSIHGTAHVARVLIHAWIIGKRHRPEITQELLAAARGRRPTQAFSSCQKVRRWPAAGAVLYDPHHPMDGRYC